MDPYKYAVALSFASDAFAQNHEDKHKIIEFAGVAMNLHKGEKVSEFREYVKQNFTLSEKCTVITGVQQHDVDEGQELRVLLDRFDQWLKSIGLHPETNGEIAFIVWEEKYLVNFLEECERCNVDRLQYLNRWINLSLYAPQTCLRTAMAKYKTQYLEAQPQAPSEASNIAKLAYHIYHQNKLIFNYYPLKKNMKNYETYTKRTRKNDGDHKMENGKPASEKLDWPNYVIFSSTAFLAFCISTVFIELYK